MKVNLFIFFRGIIKRARVVNVQGTLNELDEPARPYGISNRHWNILPQDLRGGEREGMETYIEGWEAARHANYNNPYPDQLRFEVWNRGFDAWWARRNREDVPTEPNLATIPQPNYDSYVINIVRRHMNRGLPWRGHQLHVFEPDGYPLLKIVSGINIGGMFHIVYLITRDGNTENYRVSVPLVNLQRRG